MEEKSKKVDDIKRVRRVHWRHQIALCRDECLQIWVPSSFCFLAMNAVESPVTRTGEENKLGYSIWGVSETFQDLCHLQYISNTKYGTPDKLVAETRWMLFHQCYWAGHIVPLLATQSTQASEWISKRTPYPSIHWWYEPLSSTCLTKMLFQWAKYMLLIYFVFDHTSMHTFHCMYKLSTQQQRVKQTTKYPHTVFFF